VFTFAISGIILIIQLALTNISVNVAKSVRPILAAISVDPASVDETKSHITATSSTDVLGVVTEVAFTLLVLIAENIAAETVGSLLTAFTGEQCGIRQAFANNRLTQRTGQEDSEEERFHIEHHFVARIAKEVSIQKRACFVTFIVYKSRKCIDTLRLVILITVTKGNRIEWLFKINNAEKYLAFKWGS